MTERWVAPLGAFGRDDVALAGGKGANLGELVGDGFPVPDGLVVTTAAYTAAVREAGLADRIAERLASGDDGAAIRADIEAVGMPDELRAALADGYARLGGGPVAVRSSATAEDLPGAAFAGQQDTYLNVVGAEEVVDAVRRCWASLWTERAVAYRRRRGVDSAGVSIAVVVQRMVAAESAGVLLTANPVTGDRDQLVVDANAGLGESVVSGQVTPEHYVLDATGRLREWSPGRRETVTRGAAGGGLTHAAEPATSERLLDDSALAELARLAGRAGRLFGGPHDIEWAYADGRMWLVQARPMTAVPPPPLRLNRLQRRTGWVLLEYLPVRPYPIDVTTWVARGPAAFVVRVADSLGLRVDMASMLPEDDTGVVDRLVPPSPRPTPAVLAAPFRLARRALRYDPGRWTEDHRYVAFRRGVTELENRDLTGLPWPRLVRMPGEVLALVDPLPGLRVDYLAGLGWAMLRLLVLLRLLRRGELLGDLIGGAATRTDAANRALEALADRVRATPELRRAFAELEPDRLPEVAERDDAFRAELAAFLAEYGHRETTTPLLVTPPTWKDAPEAVLGLVKALAAGPPSPPTHATASDRALDRLLSHPVVRHGRLRARAERWVRAVRTGIAVREDSHFELTRPMPVLRRTLLEIGRRLTDAGVLAQPEEVFHLRLAELEGVTDIHRLTEPDARRLRRTVRARAARRAELEGVPLIDPALVYPRPPATEDVLVSGTPASGGTATGPARVVHGPAEFGRLGQGDILVCPATNPSWTPLFQRAAAVVVDTGAAASHAAIVAREYGIPAVMGTASGTGVLKDGQPVTVNGNLGHVTPAVPEPAPDPTP